MENNSSDPLFFINGLDVNSDPNLLADTLRQRHSSFIKANGSTNLADADTQVLRNCTYSPEPVVRKTAIYILCNLGPVGWDDVEKWISDAEQVVKEAPCVAISYGLRAICELCSSDLDRCGAIFDSVFVERDSFGELDVQRSMRAEMGHNHTLESTWRGTGIILDLGKPYLTTPLVVGYLEDVLVYSDKPMSVNDPLLRSWIEGESIERKMALLALVQWFGMRKPGQREITEALAKDPNKTVRDIAQGFLARKGAPDILSRWWCEDQASVEAGD